MSKEKEEQRDDKPQRSARQKRESKNTKKNPPKGEKKITYQQLKKSITDLMFDKTWDQLKLF